GKEGSGGAGEGEGAAAEEARAATGLAVGFEDNGGQATRLEAGGGRHPRDPAADDGHVEHAKVSAVGGCTFVPSRQNRRKPVPDNSTAHHIAAPQRRSSGGVRSGASPTPKNCRQMNFER